ncbi:MAG: sugar phosphate isomerase/epimerase [Phycisphaerales bacterium]|nr:sugar phosphate isomerase/epimerase [Phycisphaerales bacterium]
MKLSLTTLGCPAWDLDTLLTNTKKFGFDGIDFRGLRGILDITQIPEFNAELPQTIRKIQNAGVEIFGYSSGISICQDDRHDRNLDEAKRVIELCQALNAKNIRVFGYGDLDNTPRSELVKIGANMMHEILALPNAKTLSWNFETHDHWILGSDTKLILDAIPSENFAAIWDTGGLMTRKETPLQTYSALAPRIRYIHLKDAIYTPADPTASKGEFGNGSGWRDVFAGEGELPLAQCITILKQNAYTGWLLYEYEKHWQPSLPDPEIAFPKFIQWIKPLIA